MKNMNVLVGDVGESQSQQQQQTNGKRLRVRRQNHSTEMIGALNACLRDECFTDACLLCEERTIKVHRIILSLFSQFFKRTFQSLQTTNMCNSPVVIVIKNLPFIDLKAIIEFIYNGEVSIPKDQLNSLMKSAANLEVEGLKSDNCLLPSSVSSVNSEQSTIPTTIPIPIPGSINGNNGFMSVPLSQQSVQNILPLKHGQKRVRLSTPNANIEASKLPSNTYQTNQTPISIVPLGPVSSTAKPKTDPILHKNKVIILKNKPKKLKPISIKPADNNLLVNQNKNIAETVSQPPLTSASVAAKVKNNELESTNTTASTLTSNAPIVDNSIGLSKLYELSNDKERKDFIDKLIKFSIEAGNPITRCPTINKLPVDLFKLYLAVKDRGGFQTVTVKQLWIECTYSCNIPSTSSAACALQIHYQKHILPFEYRFEEDKDGAQTSNTDQLNKETLISVNNSKAQVVVTKTKESVSNNAKTANVSAIPQSNNAKSAENVSIEKCSKPIEEIWIDCDDNDVTPIIKASPITQKHSTPSKTYSKMSVSEVNEIVSVSDNSSPLSKPSTSQTPTKIGTPVKTCNLCYKSFKNETLLNEHRANEHKSTKCGYCSKEFANSNLLHIHVRNDNCLRTKI